LVLYRGNRRRFGRGKALPQHRRGANCGQHDETAAAGSWSAYFLLFLLLLAAAITPPITPIHASKARRRGWIANDGFSLGGSDDRCGYRQARSNRQSQNGKDCSARNNTRLELFPHKTLLVSFGSIELRLHRASIRG